MTPSAGPGKGLPHPQPPAPPEFAALRLFLKDLWHADQKIPFEEPSEAVTFGRYFRTVRSGVVVLGFILILSFALSGLASLLPGTGFASAVSVAYVIVCMSSGFVLLAIFALCVLALPDVVTAPERTASHGVDYHAMAVRTIERGTVTGLVLGTLVGLGSYVILRLAEPSLRALAALYGGTGSVAEGLSVACGGVVALAVFLLALLTVFDSVPDDHQINRPLARPRTGATASGPPAATDAPRVEATGGSPTEKGEP